MAECFLVQSGGGDSLNFTVVGESKPDKPKANTIWVYTNQKITSWVFSATEPEAPLEGMVWFKTTSFSDTPFNALKKNNIQVYMYAAQQYVNGSWVDVVVEIYQNGQWKGFWDGTLYAPGNQYESITGGYTGSRFTNNGNSISAVGSYNSGGSIYNQMAFDVTKYNTLAVNVSYFSRENSNTAHYGLTSSKNGSFSASQEITSQGQKYLDISGLSGMYYFLVRITDTYTSSTVNVAINSIKLMNR